MRIYPLGWELTAFLMVVAGVSAGALFHRDSLVMVAVGAMVVLGPVAVLSAIMRVAAARR